MATKLLFIDRDGTLIVEPPVTYQVDSFEQLRFLPGVFNALNRIVNLTNYKLIMVTNQDGLGTDSNPENVFWPIHNFVLQTFSDEGITFDKVFIDSSFEYEKKSTRKPGTAMLTEFIDNPDFDLQNSFVLGDRLTDIQLAKNLGAKGILINEKVEISAELQNATVLKSENWSEIADFLLDRHRNARVKRKTNETDIDISLSLDGVGKCEISTGIGFFDHMLHQLARHANVNLTVKVAGDLEVDEHHTIEDTALALGEAFNLVLGDKRGIRRYGFLLPMDDAAAQVAIDFGGRPWINWQVEFKREKIGDFPTEMFYHFFKSFTDKALCNLDISARGDNEHHKIEAVFKAWAHAIRMAVSIDKNNTKLLTTKGVL